MPRGVPIGEYQPRVNAQAGVFVPERQNFQIGGALQDVGGTLSHIQQSEAAQFSLQELSKAQSEWTERLQKMQEAAEPGAPGFTPAVMKEYQSYVAKATKGTSGVTQRFLTDRLNEFGSQLQQEALKFEAHARTAHNETTAEASINSAANELIGNPERYPQRLAERQTLIESMNMDPAVKDKLLAEAQSSLSRFAAVGEVNRDPQAALEAMQKGDGVFAHVEPEVRAKLQDHATTLLHERVAGTYANSILAEYNKGIGRGDKALRQVDSLGVDDATKEAIRTKVQSGLNLMYSSRERDHIDELAGIEASIATDNADLSTFSKLSGLYDQGAIRPSEYESMVSRTAKSFEEARKKAATAAEIRQLIADKIPLDPRNQDHVKAVDNAFAEDTQGLKIGEPQWQLRANAYATQTRMLPTKAVGYIREGVRSPDPSVAAQAAQFYASAKSTAEEATSQLDSDSKWMAEQISTMLDAGTSPQHAVETVRANANAPKAVLEQRKKEYSSGQSALQLQNASKLNDYIDKDFDPSIFTRQPDASQRLKTSFDALAGQYYEKTGDIKLARDLAWKDLTATGVYGPTKVNGVSMVDLAPIEHFGVTRADIDKELAPVLAAHPPVDGSTVSDLIIVPDSLTMRQANDAESGKPIAPSYKIITKTGDLLLGENGVPLRYTVPTGEAASARLKVAQDKATEEARKALQRARDYREREANPSPPIFPNDPTEQFFR